MRTRTHTAAILVSLAALAISGCSHKPVKGAAPTPTIAAGPVEPIPVPVPAAPAPEPKIEPAPAPVPEPIPVPSAPPPAPPRPRPAPVETPRAKPDPEPPQISPQMTPRDQAEAMRHTTDDISAAEKNLQATTGKRLNASQIDLAEKVKGFLSQAHEAVRSNDWVRARNLALKAQILSSELIKSL